MKVTPGAYSVSRTNNQNRGDRYMRYHKQKRYVWKMVWLLSAIAAVGLFGCTEAQETLMQMRQELQQDIAMEEGDEAEQIGSTQEQALEVPSVEEIAGAAGTEGAGDDIRIEETYEPVQTMGTPVQEITVALYFADASGTRLVKTETSIPKVEGMARATIETLLEGPASGSSLTAVIPEGTQLLDINVKQAERKCIVDFSHEFGQILQKEAYADSALESIARTLCQFESIETVEFRIEGQIVATLPEK